ncbi:MAG: hypothetical protein ACR2O0_10545 [Rhizobiaceae bacterium]
MFALAASGTYMKTDNHGPIHPGRDFHNKKLTGHDIYQMDR